MFDVEKTQQLAQLLSVGPEERTPQWTEKFQSTVLDAALTAPENQVVQGPDGFPYFILQFPPGGEPFPPFSVSHILEYCTEQGYGIVLEPGSNPPGWVFSYGSLWMLQARGTLLWDGPVGASVEQLEAGEQRKIISGEPDEVLVPPWARAILRGYLQACGIETPMFSLVQDRMVQDTTRTPEWNLVFNIEPSNFEETEQLQGFLQHLSWFLPPYLAVLHAGDAISARFVI